MGWQPIETAPKDGTTVLTWTKGLTEDEGAIMPMRWSSTRGWCEYWGNHDLFPTHWMPLPEPPQ